MSEQVWYAVKHAGKFRRGQVYVRAQLGVLGRMAIKAGVLIPYEQAVPVTRKKGDRRGKAGVQAGGSEGVRDDSGA